MPVAARRGAAGAAGAARTAPTAGTPYPGQLPAVGSAGAAQRAIVDRHSMFGIAAERAELPPRLTATPEPVVSRVLQDLAGSALKAVCLHSIEVAADAIVPGLGTAVKAMRTVVEVVQVGASLHDGRGLDMDIPVLVDPVSGFALSVEVAFADDDSDRGGLHLGVEMDPVEPATAGAPSFRPGDPSRAPLPSDGGLRSTTARASSWPRRPRSRRRRVCSGRSRSSTMPGPATVPAGRRGRSPMSIRGPDWAARDRSRRWAGLSPLLVAFEEPQVRGWSCTTVCRRCAAPLQGGACRRVVEAAVPGPGTRGRVHRVGRVTETGFAGRIFEAAGAAGPGNASESGTP